MDQAISSFCSACAAVPSSHPNVPECRLSAARAPLRAACCRRVASEQRRMSFLCSACAAVGYALVSLHPNAEEHFDDLAAFARKKGCSQKPRKRKEFGRVIVVFYRPTCSYRIMFFYRVETSAPGLSGYYWYTVNEHLTNPKISNSQKHKEPDMATNNKNTVFVHIHHRSTKKNSFTACFFLDCGPCRPPKSPKRHPALSSEGRKAQQQKKDWKIYHP